MHLKKDHIDAIPAATSWQMSFFPFRTTSGKTLNKVRISTTATDENVPLKWLFVDPQGMGFFFSFLKLIFFNEHFSAFRILPNPFISFIHSYYERLFPFRYTVHVLVT